jgi:acetyltransferase
MAGNPIEKLMNPATIAIAGASNTFTTMGTIQCLNLIKDGFPGEILPIHPKEKIVLGKKAYQRISALPYAPDIAVLVVPTRLIPEMVEDFGKLGTRYIIIVTAGFRETGEEGRALEKVLIEKARQYGIRFLGPNCLGIVNTHLPMNITVGPIQDYNGKLGLASQSGTYIAQVVSYLHKNGIVMSKAISVGNEADITIIDCLEYLGQDETTKAIGLYIEGIKDASRFLEVARNVSRVKPIIAQYVGGTEAGARSGSSHTGAMAGPGHLYEALFKQAGIISVESIEDVYKIGWALATQPKIKGRRIAVLTNSGGPGTGIATTCNRVGLEVPEFSTNLQERISKFLPSHASARNPVDLTFHVDMKALSVDIPRILFESDEVDGIIIHGIMDTGFFDLLYPAISNFVNVSKEDLIGAMKIDLDELVSMPERYGKPLLISSFFGNEDNCINTLHTKGIPTFDSPEKAAKAMGALNTFRYISQRPEANPHLDSNVPDKALRLIQSAEATGIDEFHAKEILRAYGIPTSREALAESLDEVKAKALEIGYPVVLKACSTMIFHKTELGLVHLNLKNEEELTKAYQALRAKDPDVVLLVAEMLKGDREVMAGISRHPGFPPSVLFGLGGVFAEALNDNSLRLAPVTRFDAYEMIDDLSSRKALGAYRGMKPVDRELLADILIALGQLAIHFPQIKEIDLNPIIVVDGKPFVADALMVI